jgi:uncharacterized protein
MNAFTKIFFLGLICLSSLCAVAQRNLRNKRVLAFYTGKNDLAHISFVNEANSWFGKIAGERGFTYTATQDWSELNDERLKTADLVLFLDTRPDDPSQRAAFERYMKNGGAWIGFHFSAFALSPSSYPQNWNWYHQEFLGSGEYGSNTWRPTGAVLKAERPKHAVFKGLPATFTASPNEWYRWQNDLRQNPDIEILAAIDPVSFPLGTGPKAHEIWHNGYYPVVWTNKRYRMVYLNMGHNDMDYEGRTNKPLSATFGNPQQNKLLLNAMNWLLRS